jgi:hypothetical protein
MCPNMRGASIDIEDLERGTRASQVPSVVHGAVAPETGQDNGGGGSNSEDSASNTISHAAVEDEIAPGQ